MRKCEFLQALRGRLCGLPERELSERLAFYREMIDDRMEEGISEEDAVSAIGSVEQVAEQILSEVPLARLAKEKIKPRHRPAVWEIVLLALGSPIWLSLAIAAFAVLISIYVVLWSLVISAWAVFVSFAACALGCVLGGVGFALFGERLSGVAVIGVGIACAGLAVLMFFACIGATKGIAWLTERIALGVKKCFLKKEGAR
jgi:uncharacterized membrane protein